MTKRYRVKEIFWSVQGEGANAGTPCVFVRFAGCNLWDGVEEHRSRGAACAAYCDTDFVGGEAMTAAEVLAAMGAAWPGEGTKWCVLTGGEPLLQLDMELAVALVDAEWAIAIETNGTVAVSLALARLATHICVSPKRETDWRELGLVPDEVKVVLPGGWRDYEVEEIGVWARDAELFVQPQDEGDNGAKHLGRCLDFLRAHPEWRLSCQVHKFVGLR